MGINHEKKKTTETIRRLKTGNYSSRSGKSKLTYLIGCDPEAKIYFRIHSNTSNGFFNNDWVPLEVILELLGKSGGAFTSFALYPLLKGKSNNTPSFIIAALLEEGVIHRSMSHKRCYDLSSSNIFMDRIKPLMDSKEESKPSKKKPVTEALLPE